MKKVFLFIIINIFVIGIVSCGVTSSQTTISTDSSTNLSTDSFNSDLTTETNDTAATTEETDVILLRDSYYQYSSFSSQNILILHLNVTDDVLVYDISDNLINKDDVLIKGETYYEIKSTYVKAQAEETVEFYLVFNNYKTLVSISVSDNENPYIISSSSVYTDGESDLVFQFELFDGTVKQIDANNLTEEDFTIDGNLVTINASYVSESFLSNDKFLINFALEKVDIVIGFIMVNKEV